jgi:PadR family transcriptional regulator, regulatory protein AphA
MTKTKPDLSVPYALLGFLRDGPLHGYEIHQRLQAAQALGLVWHLKQAHLYALLGKLEALGLVAAEVVPQDARPAKRLLHLTDQGRSAFNRWVEVPVAHGRELRIEFLAKLFWAQTAASDAAHRLIEAQRGLCVQWLDELRSDAELRNTQPYEWLVLQWRRGQVEATLAWLDTCERTLVPNAVP